MPILILVSFISSHYRSSFSTDTVIILVLVHLHGHKYQLIRLAMDVTSDDPMLNPPHTEGAPNPMRRDTMVVPAMGAYNVRFIADNPGTWICKLFFFFRNHFVYRLLCTDFFRLFSPSPLQIVHCHIEWHLEAGLAMVFIEAPTESQQVLTIPQVMKDQCAALGIASTGVRSSFSFSLN